MKTNEQLAEKLLPTQAELQAEAESLASWIEQYLRDKNVDGFVPMLRVVAATGIEANRELVTVVLYGPFNEHEEKHATMRAAGKTLHEMRKAPLACTFASEA